MDLLPLAGFRDGGDVLAKVAGLSAGGTAWPYAPLFMAIAAVVAAHAIGVLHQRGVRWRLLRATQQAGTGTYFGLRHAGLPRAHSS